jgi:hypothetical protein
MLRNLLEREGLWARVEGDMMEVYPIMPQHGILSQIRVVVPADQLETARVLVDAFDSGDLAEVLERPGPWVCPSCGEENGPAFEVCWNCQTPRDGT